MKNAKIKHDFGWKNMITKLVYWMNYFRCKKKKRIRSSFDSDLLKIILFCFIKHILYYFPAHIDYAMDI